MQLCQNSEHAGCTYKTAQKFTGQFRILTELRPQDVLVYGTSDPTTNPAEVWMTAMVAELYNLKSWRFFNYPLSEPWVRQDREVIFGPYGFPYSNPNESVADMELGPIANGLKTLSFQSIFERAPKLAQMTLGQITNLIKPYRDPQHRSFNVLNLLNNGNVADQTQVFGTKKNKLFKTKYKLVSLGEVVADKSVKLGGTIIYFAYGYMIAKNDFVGLMPHNPFGGVYSAFAAGAEMAGNVARVFPVGGIDFMTTKQWELKKADKRWRKAPVSSLASLQRSSFRDEFIKSLIKERRYCPVAHDVDQDSFHFVTGSEYTY